ncbi:MAG: hypothetical protein KDA60_14645 [Planctomycetales bacterium]|nr:hypothetical protein [Planctomycetales bacterium]
MGARHSFHTFPHRGEWPTHEASDIPCIVVNWVDDPVDARPPSIGVSSPTTVGTVSPFEFPNGTYELQLFAQDATGRSSSLAFPITINSEAKLGNFNFTVTDMTLQAAGFPIAVQRTYDTLDANKEGDFGYGWSLDLVSGKLETEVSANRHNDFWARLGYQPALLEGSTIDITLPGGQVQEFRVEAVPINDGTPYGEAAGAIIAAGAPIYALAFRPAIGQGTRLDLVGGVANYYPRYYYDFMPDQFAFESFGSAHLVLDEDTGEWRNITIGGTSDLGIPFNPATPGSGPRLDYRLTLQDGTK